MGCIILDPFVYILQSLRPDLNHMSIKKPRILHLHRPTNRRIIEFIEMLKSSYFCFPFLIANEEELPMFKFNRSVSYL